MNSENEPIQRNSESGYVPQRARISDVMPETVEAQWTQADNGSDVSLQWADPSEERTTSIEPEPNVFVPTSTGQVPESPKPQPAPAARGNWDDLGRDQHPNPQVQNVPNQNFDQPNPANLGQPNRSRPETNQPASRARTVVPRHQASAPESDQNTREAVPPGTNNAQLAANYLPNRAYNDEPSARHGAPSGYGQPIDTQPARSAAHGQVDPGTEPTVNIAVTEQIYADSQAPGAAKRPDKQEFEQARLERQRLAEERAARSRSTSPEVAQRRMAEPEDVKSAKAKPSYDQLFNSAGLLIFRIIVAGILAVRGFQMLTSIPELEKQLSRTLLPEPATIAWLAAISTLAIALAVFLGVFTRLAGLGLAIEMALAIGFVRWGDFPLFLTEGFFGELELLLVGVGILLFAIGSGRWGIDGAFRAAREKEAETN